MCGICGKLNFDTDNPISESLLRQMCAVIVHRGPDDEGVYVNQNVGLGNRRLAVIDLSPAAHQPMPNENKSIWITSNGEIYNHPKLRQELEKRGHRFRSHSDTEVILHLYEEYGASCVHQLRGMFAFAIWDSNRQRLFLARDRLGQKPLVYAVVNGSLIFASEIKSILQDPSVNREVDPEAIHHYLTYQYVPSPWTAFKGIEKLPPAHILICEQGEIRIERYWDLNYAHKVEMSEEEYGKRIIELLREATRIRLMSDVPLGVLLSGGIDSSSVVAMMSQLSNEPVKTFSIGFEEQSFDELKYARLVAERFGTKHHEFIVKPEAIKVLPELIWHYNEPFADSSAMPTYYVAKVTRQHVTVALNGDGGDESFGGYERYLAAKLANYYQKVPALVREGVIGPLINKLPESTERKDLFRRLKRFTAAMSHSPERRYIRWVTPFDNDTKERLYSSEFRERLDGIDSTDLLLDVYARADGANFLDKTFYVDIMTYLPNALLVKMDIASMAHSLETRSPYLDHHLMEFAASIPSGLKLRGLTTKHILKRALARILPPETLHREKMGFGVPVGHWFRHELKEMAYQILLDRRSAERGYFDMGFVKNLLDEHLSGRVDHGYRIWALLNLEFWHRMFIDSSEVSKPSLTLF